MDLQSVLILIVSFGLVVAGVGQITRTSRRNRLGRETDRRGMLLLIIGAVYIAIVLISKIAR